MLFRPRCGVHTPACNLRTNVLKQTLELPFLLAPLGSSRMFCPRGEERAAAAAGKAGTAYVLSTFSGTRLEVVKTATSGPCWYQLYLAGGRDLAAAALERAAEAGFSSLVVTVDTAVAGMRERDYRNGMTQLVGRGAPMLRYLPQMLSKPRWLAGFLRDGGIMQFPNLVLPSGPMTYSEVGSMLEQSVVCWNDLPWIRRVWKGPLVIKGIQRRADARIAVDEGADAVVVSNHGGRQLDGVSASLQILPGVVEEVGRQAEVLFDGGIRRGSDIVKALCLGARAVLVGRAYGYGLGAAGEAGVTRAIEILRSDLVRTMKLLGCASVHLLDRSYLETDESGRRCDVVERVGAL